jgi:hypothetical protein
MSTKVRVNKSELIAKLKENCQIHIQEFEELKTDYMTVLDKRLKEIQKDVKAGNFNVSVHINAAKPTSYESDYREVIGMLEMSVDDIFEIDQEEYRQYVLNNWSWSRSFAVTKAAYGKF